MHDWIVDADGEPTVLTRQVSSLLVGAGAAWAAHRVFGRRYVALLTLAVVYGAHQFLDGPVARKIVALA